MCHGLIHEYIIFYYIRNMANLVEELEQDQKKIHITSHEDEFLINIQSEGLTHVICMTSDEFVELYREIQRFF